MENITNVGGEDTISSEFKENTEVIDCRSDSDCGVQKTKCCFNSGFYKQVCEKDD